MRSPSKTRSRTAKVIAWLNPEPLTSVEQRVVAVFGLMAVGAAVAAALGEDAERGAFTFGFGAALIVLIALEAHYRRRYSPRRKNGSK